MIRKFSKKLIDSISDENYSKVDLEQMDYVLRIILFEAMKDILLTIIFSLAGYFKEIVIIIGLMIVTKPFIGGYHEYSQIKCFITSIILITADITLSFTCTLNFWSNCILIVISIFCIYNQAPIINPQMPLTRLELINKNRKIGLRNSIVIGMISIILYRYSKYYTIITWTVVFEALLLFNKRQDLK